MKVKTVININLLEKCMQYSNTRFINPDYSIESSRERSNDDPPFSFFFFPPFFPIGTRPIRGGINYSRHIGKLFVVLASENGFKILRTNYFHEFEDHACVMVIRILISFVVNSNPWFLEPCCTKFCCDQEQSSYADEGFNR